MHKHYGDIKSGDKIDMTLVFSRSAFDEVFNLPIPMHLIFESGNFNKKARSHLGQGNLEDRRFAQWTRDLQTEAELAERVWHRLRALHLRQSIDGSMGNPDYLAFLHKALWLNMSETKGYSLI